MTTPLLSAEQLEALRRYNTPTISNAIEVFNVRKRHLGFLPHSIRCMFPDLGADRRLCGHRTDAGRVLGEEASPDILADYFRYVAARAGPEDRRGRRTSTTRPAWGPSSAR